jgi:hypothetical protein
VTAFLRVLNARVNVGSETVRSGIKDILLEHAQLWEALRAKASA